MPAEGLLCASCVHLHVQQLPAVRTGHQLAPAAPVGLSQALESLALPQNQLLLTLLPLDA